MATLYSVIRYLPNALSDECVNVGLVIVDNDSVHVHSLQSWDRVKCFGGRDWKHVQRLVADMRQEPRSLLEINPGEDAKAINCKLARWQRNLQFTEVKGSLETAEQLAGTLASVFLPQTSDVRLDASTRRKTLVDNIYAAVKTAYSIKFDRKPTGILKRDAKARGKLTSHNVDVGIANGSLYAGAFTITFANQQENRQWRDTDAIAFALEDLDVKRTKIPMAVLIDAPTKSNASERARALLPDLGAELIETANIQSWAQTAVSHVPDSVAG